MTNDTIGERIFFFWSIYSNTLRNKPLDVIFERLFLIVFAFPQVKTFQSE